MHVHDIRGRVEVSRAGGAQTPPEHAPLNEVNEELLRSVQHERDGRVWQHVARAQPWEGERGVGVIEVPRSKTAP